MTEATSQLACYAILGGVCAVVMGVGMALTFSAIGAMIAAVAGRGG